MSQVSVSLILAAVMAQLSPNGITFVLRPGQLEYSRCDGHGTEATDTLPLEVVPPELRAPNTPVWIITKRYGELSKDTRFETEVLARHGDTYPEQYKQLQSPGG